MILIKNYTKVLFASLALFSAVSCSNPWDDRTDTSDENLKFNLSERIKNTSEISEFAKLLEETGLDEELSNSKTYTVWAPTNAALSLVDPSLLSDINKKRLFVLNHFALTAYSSVSENDTVSVQMYSNKYLDFINGTKMDEATVLLADQYASNGVFHIVDKALEPKINIWQYVKANATTNTMCAYLLSLDEFNIYKTDSIAKAFEFHEAYSDSLTNSYLKNVYNLNNEKKKYTFFLLENDGFDAEVTKLEPYLTKSNQDSTTTYTRYFTARDFAYPRVMSRENLPDTLVSRFGVKVPIDKNNIVREVKLSNGIIYVMNALDVPLEKRLLTTKIEGENPIGFSRTDKRANTFYRVKNDANGVLFNDIMVQNHGAPLFGINYNANNLYSTTYKVYWRAINDIQSNVFQQKLTIGGVRLIDNTILNPIMEFPYIDVPLNIYDEILIGEFTLDQAGSIDLITLIAANSGVNGVNTLSLDYLKLVPVIK